MHPWGTAPGPSVPHVTPLVQPGHQPVPVTATLPSVSILKRSNPLLIHLTFVKFYGLCCLSNVQNFYIIYLGITEFANDKVNLYEPSSSDWQEHTAAEGKK